LALCIGCQNVRPATEPIASRRQTTSAKQIASSSEPSKADNEQPSHATKVSADANTVILASATEPLEQPGPCLSPDAPAPTHATAADYPIDLPTALRLAGANNLQIRFTRDQLHEAEARWDGAQALWLPTLTAGPGYNKHNGRIQATEGDVSEVSRNSTYVGTSPTMVLGGGPISTIDITDALFEPLAAAQIVRAREAAVARSMNDTLLSVAIAFLDLLEAESQQAISRQDVENVRQLVQLTEAFAKAGQGLESDAARARSELATRERELIAADEAAQVRSVRLANLLRLDPSVKLHTTQTAVVPLHLIADSAALPDLIAQAQSERPENEEQAAIVRSALERVRQETMRPFVPRLLADFAAGGYGGGEGSHLTNFSDRTDFTILAVWELRNLGFGNRAIQRQREAQLLQAETFSAFVREIISAEVAEAYHQAHERRRQIEVAQKSVVESLKSLELNMNRIRGAEGLPIEVLQAIQSVAVARRAYLTAVTDYNRAQFLLLRAVGQPASAL
jgi:outer membrane protein TolC